VELPEIKEGAMSSLEIFNMMDCPKLKILPQTYLNLGIKIRVYGCPELEVVENRNLVQVVAMAEKHRTKHNKVFASTSKERRLVIW
jgi:hypothetical protein